MNDQDQPNRSRVWIGVILGLLLIGGGIGSWRHWRMSSQRQVDVANTIAAPATLPAAVADAPLAPRQPGLVYQGHFTKAAGPEWSQQQVWAPNENAGVPGLGPVREKPLLFTLDRLPAHQFIRVTFKLLTYQPWNGDSANFGRDLWDMRVVGGQPLIHTTFSNCGYFTNNNEQSFPDQYPWYPTHPGWTGAASRQTMGYKSTIGGSGGMETNGTDSTYDFDLIFPHSANTLQLQFRAVAKGHEFKPYGFLTFSIETVDHPAAADESTLAGWWDDLTNDNPVKAYHAVWSMIATGDAATKYIQAHLPPVNPTDPYPLNIDQEKLWKHGSFSLDTPEARREARAIHVLEVIGSSDSIAMLKAMGYTGTPEEAPPDAWTKTPASVVLKQAEEDLVSNDPPRIVAAVARVRRLIIGEQSEPGIKLLLKYKRFKDVDSACLAAMLARMDLSYWVSKCQRARTEALMNLDDSEKALSAAKAYFNVALMAETDDATSLIAACLEKARPDGSALADRFSRQQLAWAVSEYSPDVQNLSDDPALGAAVLPTIKIDPKPYETFLSHAGTNDYGACVARGNALLLSDQPAEAKAAFEQSATFAKGPRIKASTQNIARAIRAEKGCLGPASKYVSQHPAPDVTKQ